MRSLKVLLAALTAASALAFAFTTHSASAQTSIPACNDKAALGTILTAVSQDPFKTAMGNLGSAATPDDFATIVDTAIQTRHTVGDVSTSDTGCIYLQLATYGLVDDLTDVATYYSFIKENLKASDTYTKNLADAQARLKKDLATWQTVASASAGSAAATAAPTASS